MKIDELKKNFLMKTAVASILNPLFGLMVVFAHIANVTNHTRLKVIRFDLAPMNVHDVNANSPLPPKRRCIVRNIRFGLGCKQFITSSIRVKVFHQSF